MEIVAMVIALGIIYWLSGLNWVFWTIFGAGIFIWLCGQAVLNSRNDLATGCGTERVYKFWYIVYGIGTWIYIALCIIAILYIIIYK